MRSKTWAARWCALVAACALLLAGAPAASAAPPNVHPNVGSYSSQTPIDVSFVTDQPVTIHYTTDGSVPSASSPTYTTTLHFTRTTFLRWVAGNAAGETAAGQELYTIDN